MTTAASTLPPARPQLSRHLGDRLLASFGLLVMLLALAALGVLLYNVAHDGMGRLSWAFLTSYPSRRAEQAGILPALVGSLYVIGLTTLIAVPLGVGAAVHLEEYGGRGRLSRLIEINIANLAGVPSIIYGLLGLGLFVRTFGMGQSVLAAGSTMALLSLPVIIIATREALRAVPKSLREGSYALGATKWQTIWHQVLPAAFPGILTGLILALSRAIGETAPLVVVGATAFMLYAPDGLDSDYTALPMQIFQWTSSPKREFLTNAAAGICVLIVVLIVLNSVAIWLRNRYQKRAY